jgi:hypothetical protein
VVAENWMSGRVSFGTGRMAETKPSVSDSSSRSGAPTA